MENDSRMALFVADLKALIRKWEVPHGEQRCNTGEVVVPHTRLESGSISNTGEVVDYSVDHSVKPADYTITKEMCERLVQKLAEKDRL